MKRWVIVLLLTLFLTGCAKTEPEKVRSSTVVRMQVQGADASCTLETQAGMSAVLSGLRQLQSLGRAEEDPEILESENYVIRLWLADGRQVRYYFRSGGYLSKNEGPWQKLDLKSAQRFVRLLRILTA